MKGRPDGLRSHDREWGDLIRRIAQEDEAALESFYQATGRLVHGLVLRILGDRESAEEVTLDVYLQIWRQARNYDPARGNPVAWLLTLARSRAIDRLRSASRTRRGQEPLDAAHAIPADGASPEEESAFAERRRLVHAALERLSPLQREAISIAYFSGLSHTEIAEKLGLPLGTIKTRIRLGMIRLRELLEPLDEGARG